MGQWLTLGYQDEGATALLKDGVTTQVGGSCAQWERACLVEGGRWDGERLCASPPPLLQVTLTSCSRNCSVSDPPISAAFSRANYPDKYRVRGSCGNVGLCAFLWALTDANGALLGPPNVTMTTPFLVPQGAAFITLGYSEINYCSCAGSVGMCIFGAAAAQGGGAPASLSPSASRTSTPTPSATPSSSAALVYVTITVAIAGADAAACLATPACPAALALALQGALGGNVSNLTVVAAGAGPLSPTASAPPAARRLAAAGPAEDARPRMLLASQGAAAAASPLDVISSSIFSSYASDPHLPLWATLRVRACVRTSGRRLEVPFARA